MKNPTKLAMMSIATITALAQRQNGALGAGPGGNPYEVTYYRDADRTPNATRSVTFAPDSRNDEQWTLR